MNKPLVSVIVPVYNTKDFLEECVWSCVHQDYKNYEVLLIDDGSTDGSGTLCEKLSNDYDTVFVYHKPNGGLSDARNYGMEKANGDYIMFVDSDDLVSSNIISLLVDSILRDKSDLAVCGLVHFVNGKYPVYEKETKKSILSSKEALIELLYQKSISISSCAKLYDRKLILEEKFVKGQRFEDNDFLFRVIKKCASLSLSNAKLYGYRHRENSITTLEFTEKDFDIIYIGYNIIGLTQFMDNEVKKAAVAYQCSNVMRVYLTVTPSYFYDKRYIYCKKYIEQHAWDVIKDTNARNKIKIALLFYKLHISRQLIMFVRNRVKRWK